MSEPSEGNEPHTLPPSWLPDPQPPDGAVRWEAATRRIMAAAEPELRRLRSRGGAAAGASWWSEMGLWWRPAAAVAAAAAAALLVLLERSTAVPGPAPGSVPLGLVASDGDPVTIWRAVGIEADPVLARIAIQGSRDAAEPRTFPVARKEDDR